MSRLMAGGAEDVRAGADMECAAAQHTTSCVSARAIGAGYIGRDGCVRCACPVYRRCARCCDASAACGSCVAADAVLRAANAVVWMVARLRLFGYDGGLRPGKIMVRDACEAVDAVLGVLFTRIQAHRPDLLFTHTVLTCRAGYFARELQHSAVGLLPLCVALSLVAYADGKHAASRLHAFVRTLVRALPASAGPALTRTVGGWVRGHVYMPLVLFVLLRGRDTAVNGWLADAAPHIAADPDARARLADAVAGSPEVVRTHVLRACFAAAVATQVVSRWTCASSSAPDTAGFAGGNSPHGSSSDGTASECGPGTASECSDGAAVTYLCFSRRETQAAAGALVAFGRVVAVHRCG